MLVLNITFNFTIQNDILSERERAREREKNKECLREKGGQGKGYCQLQFSFVNPIISINWLISCCIISLQIETGCLYRHCVLI